MVGTVRRGMRSLVTLAGGAALAVVPAASVSIASRLFDQRGQGWVAVAVLIATFAGQIAFSVVVEARLASPGRERRVVLPRWLVVLAVGAAVVVAVTPPNAVVLSLALPLMSAGLEVGRGVSVAERLDRREAVASVAVGGGAVVGVAAALLGQRWALVPVVVGIAAATLVRARPVPHRASPMDPNAMRWVLTDTAVTGVVPPLLNAVILGRLSAVDAVLFTSVSTVSGLLAIPLNFMRLRLLKERSRLDVVLSAASLAAAVLVIVGLELAGVFGLLFGAAWTRSPTIVPLLVACAWRAASLATTIPFTALRRAGAVRLVTGLRASVSILTVVLALVGLVLAGLTGAFAGLLVSEMTAATVLAASARRHGRRISAAPVMEDGVS